MAIRRRRQGRKRYALVGTGHRAGMFLEALAGSFADAGELVGLCDVNRTRMAWHNADLKRRFGHAPVPTYGAEDFDRMVKERRPDVVIVTTVDRLHHRYVCRAMELGCDAVTEKPMTVDAEKCQQIVDTAARTGKHLTVTFNYRYAPKATRIKELIRAGTVGEVLSVHFEWLLNTCHGADYFRRWHRDKRNSGGLLVHKSTHHFDLVNWWLATAPQTVFAMGDLRFYGRENAEARGVTEFYSRARGSAVAAQDPFALKIGAKDPVLKGLYLDAEHEDQYYRDQSVFGDGISIEDTMAVMVRYRSRAVMTYSLNAHCPWEGYRVMFNGTRGRLELNVVESYFCGDNPDFNAFGMHELAIPDGQPLTPEIIFQPHWGRAQVVDCTESAAGAHGGGDIRLLGHLFRGAADDPLGHAAGLAAGVDSIMVGIAANQSIRTGLPVEVDRLVRR